MTRTEPVGGDAGKANVSFWVGVEVAGVDDLAAALRNVDAAGLRRRVAEARFDFTVEANIQPIVDLYKTLVG